VVICNGLNRWGKESDNGLSKRTYLLNNLRAEKIRGKENRSEQGEKKNAERNITFQIHRKGSLGAHKKGRS